MNAVLDNGRVGLDTRWLCWFRHQMNAILDNGRAGLDTGSGYAFYTVQCFQFGHWQIEWLCSHLGQC